MHSCSLCTCPSIVSSIPSRAVCVPSVRVSSLVLTFSCTNVDEIVSAKDRMPPSLRGCGCAFARLRSIPLGRRGDLPQTPPWRRNSIREGVRYDPRSLSSDRILDRLPFLWVRREGNHPCLHLLNGGSRNRADPIVEGRPTQGTWDRPSIPRCVLTPWPPCPTTRWGRPGPPEDTIRRTRDA